MENGKQSKRALFVANRAFGIFSSRMPILKQLKAQGWTVAVAGNRDGTDKQLEAIGCEFIEVPFSSGGLHPVQDLQSMVKLGQVFRKFRPQLVHNFNAKPVILGTFLGRFHLGASGKIVNTITGLGYAYLKSGFVQRLGNLCYRSLLDRADRTIFQNESDRNRFLKGGLVAESKSSTIVSSGVDTNRFVSQREPGSNGSIEVVFVGRLLWQKGFREFVTAAEILRERFSDIRFSVYGELAESHPNGVPQSFLQRAVERGIVEYHGFVKEIEKVYQSTDILVFPSYYGEGVPRVVLEANACQIPAVVCQAGWVDGVIKSGENGLVVKPKSADEIVLAVAKLHEDRQELRQMGQKAREHMVRNFKQGDIIEKYLDVYRTLMKVSL